MPALSHARNAENAGKIQARAGITKSRGHIAKRRLTAGGNSLSRVDRAVFCPYVSAQFRQAFTPAFRFNRGLTMKIRNSLKALMTRHRANKLVRRRGRVYIINKVDKRYKARQG